MLVVKQHNQQKQSKTRFVFVLCQSGKIGIWAYTLPMSLESGFSKKSVESNVSSQETVFDQWNQWKKDSERLILEIDRHPQLEETDPGIRFSQDLAKLLDPEIVSSRFDLVGLLDDLSQDLRTYDFSTARNDKKEEYIHMAHESAPLELGNLFGKFATQLRQFPIPLFDKELIQKRDALVAAFTQRADILTGK